MLPRSFFVWSIKLPFDLLFCRGLCAVSISKKVRIYLTALLPARGITDHCPCFTTKDLVAG